MPLIHGHWQQRTLSVSAKALTVSIIARRSKFFAGTRYRKRGINDQGHVANDVETEQVRVKQQCEHCAIIVGISGMLRE